MKKWACAGKSDLISGTWKMSCIEFINIQVGNNRPVQRATSIKKNTRLSVVIIANSEINLIKSEVSAFIKRMIGCLSCDPCGTSKPRVFLKYFVPQKVIRI